MSWYHPEEEHEVGVILSYQDEHPDARYLVKFVDGESYICTYDTAYESENSGELDIEMDDPRYDEFFRVELEIIETLKDGTRRYNEWLGLDYRDFPALIEDADTGAMIYPPQTVAQAD